MNPPNDTSGNGDEPPVESHASTSYHQQEDAHTNTLPATCLLVNDATSNPPDTKEIDAAATLKKKRLCRFPGCTKVIKSQGHCQRHGARAKRCRVQGCDKQAQGTHDGMCKRHWKAVHFPDLQTSTTTTPAPPPPVGESVYDNVLPLSIAFRPGSVSSYNNSYVTNAMIAGVSATVAHAASEGVSNDNNQHDGASTTPHIVRDESDAPEAPPGVALMPLIIFLQTHRHQPSGWHRNQERRARGVFPVTSLTCQLEPWERQLALVELLLLSGGTPYANFRDLAHAWGREKGFHTILANAVCERRGAVERKRRSDAGRILTADEKQAVRTKRQATEASMQQQQQEQLLLQQQHGDQHPDDDLMGGNSNSMHVAAAAAAAGMSHHHDDDDEEISHNAHTMAALMVPQQQQQHQHAMLHHEQQQQSSAMDLHHGMAPAPLVLDTTTTQATTLSDDPSQSQSHTTMGV